MKIRTQFENFKLREGRCSTLPPARRMDEDKPVGRLRCVRPGCFDVTCLHLAYGILSLRISAVMMCIIKHKTWHWPTPAYKLLHLHKISAL